MKLIKEKKAFLNMININFKFAAVIPKDYVISSGVAKGGPAPPLVAPKARKKHKVATLWFSKILELGPPVAPEERKKSTGPPLSKNPSYASVYKVDKVRIKYKKINKSIQN